jgi:DNA-binding PadR family transcriptional regulator
MTSALSECCGRFLANPSAQRYGYDLTKSASLKSGTLYPLLSRLEDQ